MALTKIKGAGINISATEKLYFDGGGNTYIHESAADVLKLVVGGVAFMDATEGTNAIVFNEGSVDMDFRVESNGNANMLFVDGGNDRVGIGESSPDAPLEIAGSSGNLLHLDGTSNTYLELDRSATNRNGSYTLATAGTVNWAMGVSDSDEAGDGSEFFIGTSTDSTSAKLWIETNGKVGIGTSSPATALHVSSASNSVITFISTDGDNDKTMHLAQDVNRAYLGSSLISVIQSWEPDTGNVGIGTAVPSDSHADADNLVIGTASGNNGMTIMGATNGYGSVFFADATDGSAAEYDGAMQYSFGDPSMRFNVGGSIKMFINSTGNVGIGETAPPAPLTINQGADDGSIVEFKSSDVAHGMTDNYETDTYGAFSKASALGGGFRIEGYSEGKNGILLDGISDSDNTAKSTSAAGNVMIRAWKKNNNSWDTIEANGNLFTCGNGNAVRFIVDEDGDIFYDGSASAYDSYNDAQLVRAFDSTMSPKNIIQSKWDKFVTYKEKDLVEANLLGKVSDKEKAEGVRPLVSLTGMSRLHNGAIWQQYTEMQKMKELMYDAMVELMGKEKADNKLKDHNIKLLLGNA